MISLPLEVDWLVVWNMPLGNASIAGATVHQMYVYNVPSTFSLCVYHTAPLSSPRLRQKCALMGAALYIFPDSASWCC